MKTYKMEFIGQISGMSTNQFNECLLFNAVHNNELIDIVIDTDSNVTGVFNKKERERLLNPCFVTKKTLPDVEVYEIMKRKSFARILVHSECRLFDAEQSHNPDKIALASKIWKLTKEVSI